MLRKKLLFSAVLLSLSSANTWAINEDRCVANYDGQSLHIPCVNISGQEQMYTVNLTSQLSGDQLSFNLQDFAPLANDTPITPVQLPDGVTIDSIEVGENAYPGTGEPMPIIVKYTLPNYCHQITNGDQFYQPIEHDGTGHYKINLSIASNPECDVELNPMATDRYSFEIHLTLRMPELEYDSYTLTINDAITKTITPAFKAGTLPEVTQIESHFYINPQDPVNPSQLLEIAQIRAIGTLSDPCDKIAHTPEFTEAMKKGLTVGENNTFNLPLKSITVNESVCRPPLDSNYPNEFNLPFKLNIENLPTGEYHFAANGKIVHTMFISTPLSEGVNTNIDDELLIYTYNVELETAAANQVRLKIQGFLSNTCQTLATPTTAVTPNAAGHFEVVVRSNPLPDNTLCKSESTAYTAYIPLNTNGLAAGYHKAVVNGRVVVFFKTN